MHLTNEVASRELCVDIIGASDAIKETMRRTYQVARTKTTVLFTGETGTGKSMLARFLHWHSDRRHKPFITVNCAGLYENLAANELFGWEKAASTGLTTSRIGRFGLANGGTIFLDQIGELPLDLQAKLLKVMEEGKLERSGTLHPVSVDIRIISSTTRSLENEITKGRFRKDLFYRINVFPINIPPLRERREDIHLISRFYVGRFAKIHGKEITTIPKTVLKTLESYDWPGNVRELINVVERAVIVSEGIELLLAEPLGESPSQRSIVAGRARDRKPEEAKSLAGMERRHIIEALDECSWRIEGPRGAALRLQINPSTLRSRMRKLGIKYAPR